MIEFIQQLINGLAQGSIYALIALGYTMVFGVLRFINFAHGDVFMLGAFAGLYTAPTLLKVFGGGPSLAWRDGGAARCDAYLRAHRNRNRKTLLSPTARPSRAYRPYHSDWGFPFH